LGGGAGQHLRGPVPPRPQRIEPPLRTALSKRSSKMGFLGNFGGRGEDIWWESTSVLRTARFQTSLSRSDAPCSRILYGIAICYRRNFGQVWGSPAPYQKSQENCAAGWHPFGHSTTIGKIVIILRCNPWAVG